MSRIEQLILLLSHLPQNWERGAILNPPGVLKQQVLINQIHSTYSDTAFKSSFGQNSNQRELFFSKAALPKQQNKAHSSVRTVIESIHFSRSSGFSFPFPLPLNLPIIDCEWDGMVFTTNLMEQNQNKQARTEIRFQFWSPPSPSRSF